MRLRLYLPILMIGFVVTFLAYANLLEAADLNPSVCNEIFGLPTGTIQREVDKKLLGKPEVCEAYKFLISRYTPGPRSSVGLSNPKVQGITRLNPDFAVALAKMLKAAPYMTIVSAYRTPAGQGSKNPQSNHIYGCAVDLGYSQNSCGSAHCQFVYRNAASTYGIQIRMKYAPEWNHVEPVNVQVCRAAGPGGGITPGKSSTDPYKDWPEDERGGDIIRSPFSTPLSNGVPPPMPAPPPSQQNQQCQPRYQCSGNTLMYIDSSCQQQPYQQCPGGCNGDVCVANPPQQQQPQQTSQPQQQPSSGQTGSQPTGGTSSSGNTTGANNPGTQALPSPNPVSDLLSSPLLSGYTELPRIPTSTPLKVPKATTTPFDLIQRYAQETSTTTDATEEEEDYYIQPDVSEILNADLTDVTHIRPNTRPLEEVLDDAPPSRPNTATGTLAIQRPIGQTFVTNDLKDSPVPAATTSNVSSNSTIGRILTNLRTILEWALRFLRSFNQNPVAPLPTATFQPIPQFGE